MDKQTMTVPLSRDLLKPEDFKLDDEGNLIIDKKQISKLVKENINKTPPDITKAVSVGVVVKF